MTRPAGPAFARSDLFGGTGTVHIWDLLAGRPAPPFSAALWCELEPGGIVGAHQQQRDPEIVICLAGTGRALVNDRPQDLAPGALVHLPLGSVLRLENSGDEPLRYLIIKAR